MEKLNGKEVRFFGAEPSAVKIAPKILEEVG